MKPILYSIGWMAALLSAPWSAVAQSKLAPPELLTPAPAWPAENQLWGTVPPPKPLPYGYVWNEYRGAEVEHPLYAPRHHGHAVRSGGPGCLVSQFCCWFDKLFTRNCAASAPAPCAGHVATDLPPLPTLAAPPSSGVQTDLPDLEPAPIPTPPPPAMATPAPAVVAPAPPLVVAPAPPPAASPSPAPGPVAAPAPSLAQPAPAEPTPVMPPVDLIPTRPLVAVPAPETAPVPTEPAPATPNVDEPRPLDAAVPPVVKLAPDFVMPAEPTGAAPPLNTVPPSATVPRNTIPPQALPLNTGNR
jgi:hypothetical protein